MAATTTIEWTEATWNPVTGCTKVSAGCAHCYAERMARRLQAMGVPQYRDGFRVTLHPDALEIPLAWKKPRVVFVNSMSDLFHEEIPQSFIRETFEVMRQAHQHVFQVLTKRSERLADLAPRLPWVDNVWLGVTVESADHLDRIELLRSTPAALRFLSLEPLLGPLPRLNLEGIDWVIVGGESGPGARPLRKEWVLEIRDQCLDAEVPFFFKQWGGTRKTKAGRVLEGQVWSEMPKKDLNRTGRSLVEGHAMTSASPRGVQAVPAPQTCSGRPMALAPTAAR